MSGLRLISRRKAIEEQKTIATAALHNEELTRKRVAALEDHAEGVAKLLARDLLGRLKWLFLGR